MTRRKPPTHDLNGNPIVIVKCMHCGKVRGDHRAKTFQCPMGIRHRTLGYTTYHPTNVFTPKPAK